MESNQFKYNSGKLEEINKEIDSVYYDFIDSEYIVGWKKVRPLFQIYYNFFKKDPERYLSIEDIKIEAVKSDLLIPINLKNNLKVHRNRLNNEAFANYFRDKKSKISFYLEQDDKGSRLRITYGNKNYRDLISNKRYQKPSTLSLSSTVKNNEIEDSIVRFFKDIEKNHKYIKNIYSDKKILLENIYIPCRISEIENNEESNIPKSFEERFWQSYNINIQFNKASQLVLPLNKFIKDHNRILIYSYPGMGKSTLINIKVLDVVNNEINKFISNVKSLNNIIVPIYFHAFDLASTNKELFDSIIYLLCRDYPEHSDLIGSIIKEKLFDGHFILFIDGLDEVPSDKSKSFSDKINRFSRNYKGTIIYTSRMVSYLSGLINDTFNVSILPFSQTDISYFIHKWFEYSSSVNHNSFSMANSLINEVNNNPHISLLSQIPLFLFHICSLYETDSISLPLKRYNIYEYSINHLLLKRKPISYGRIEAKKRLLEILSYKLFFQNKLIFSRNDLFDEIENYLKSHDNILSDFSASKTSDIMNELCEEDGIIINLSINSNMYSFLHPSFQEYFTASYLSRIINSSNSYDYKNIFSHIWDFRWHEVLIMLSSMLVNSDDYFQALSTIEDDIFSTLLIFTSRCITEANYINNDLSNMINNHLYLLWEQSSREYNYIQSAFVNISKIYDMNCDKVFHDLINYDDPYINYNAFNALLYIGTPYAIHKFIDAYKSKPFLRVEICKVFRYFRSPLTKDLLIEGLKDNHYLLRDHCAWALAPFVDDDLIDILTPYLYSDDVQLRTRISLTLFEIDNNKVYDELIKRFPIFILSYDFYSYGTLLHYANKVTLNILKHYVINGNDHFNRIASWCLGAMGNTAAGNTLISILDEQDILTLQCALSGLHTLAKGRINITPADAYCDWNELKDNNIIGILSKLSKHKNNGIKRQAIDIIGLIGNIKQESLLLPFLTDDDIEIKFTTAKALANIGSTKSNKALIHFLDKDSEYLEDAIDIFIKYPSKDAEDALATLLDCDSSIMKWNILKALHNLGSTQMLKYYTNALEEGSEWLLSKIIEALGHIKNNNTINIISKYLYSDSNNLRHAAISALQEINTPKSFKALKHYLNNSYHDNQFVLKILAEKGDDESIIALLDTVFSDDTDFYKKHIAANTLSEIKHPKAIKAYHNLMKIVPENEYYSFIRKYASLYPIDFLKQVITDPDIDIYHEHIFLLIRELIITYGNNTEYYPLYKKTIDKYKTKNL